MLKQAADFVETMNRATEQSLKQYLGKEEQIAVRDMSCRWQKHNSYLNVNRSSRNWLGSKIYTVRIASNAMCMKTILYYLNSHS